MTVAAPGRRRAPVGLSVAVLALVSSAVLAAAGPDDQAEARTLYQRGAQLYREGRYPQAVELFERAYVISAAKPLLFNIAQSYRLAGPSFCDRALHAYEAYLREDPQATNRDEVRQRIAEMRGCLQAAAAHPAPDSARLVSPVVAVPPAVVAVAPPPPAPLPPPHSHVWPRIAIGGGAAVLTAGAILYWRARVKFEDAQPTCPCPAGTFSGWEAATTASYGLLALGAATAIAGLAWWALDRRAAQREAHVVAVGPGTITLLTRF